METFRFLAFGPHGVFLKSALWVSVICLGAACGNEKQAAAAVPSPAVTTAVQSPTAPPPSAAAPQAKAPEDTAPSQNAGQGEVDDPTFLLRASTAGPYRAGELGQFSVSLIPRGEYHVNEEYPLSLGVSGPQAIGFPKQELTREDASEFGEERAVFRVPFTPTQAGDHKIQAKVDFAVCTPENCIPDQRTLAVLLPVQ